MKKIVLIIIMTMSIQYTWAGGGWVNATGSGYFKLSEYIIRANDFFNPEGDIIDITTISYYATNLYGEYGINDRLTVMGNIPIFVRTTLNEIEFRQSGSTIPGDAENNIGDPLIGFKYGFFQGKSIVLSTSLLFGIPLGEDVGGEGGILQTGDGEFNQLLRVEASHSFYPLPVYATVTLGFNNRTNSFSEEFHYGFELGYTFKSKALFTLKMYGVESLKNGEPGGFAGNGIFSNNTEYLSVRPGLAYYLDNNWGIAGEIGFAPRGERILASPSYEFGIFFNW